MPPAIALNPNAPPWVSGKQSSQVSGPAQSPQQEDDAIFPLQELPEEVVSSILEHTAKDGSLKDVLSVGTACKALLTTLAGAGLSLRAELPATASSSESGAYISAFVRSLQKLMPGVRGLDVRGLALENLDALWLATSPALPRLSILDASNCRKLTPWLSDALGVAADASRAAHATAAAAPPVNASAPAATSAASSAAAAGGSSAAPTPVARLQAISLQRCFQLAPGCLTHLLRAAAGPGGMPLVSLNLSHLELQGWPLLGCASSTALMTATQAMAHQSAGVEVQGHSSRDSSVQPSAPGSLAGSLESCLSGVERLFKPKLTAALGAVFDAAGAAARERVCRVAAAARASRAAGESVDSSNHPLQQGGSSLGNKEEGELHLEEEEDGDGKEGAATGPLVVSLTSGGGSEEDDDEEEDTWVEHTHIGGAAQALLDALHVHAGPVPGPPLGLPTTQLRVLSLNNCTKLSGLGLITLALTCPRLQLLLLGGCNLESQYVAQGLPVDNTTGTGSDAGAGFELPHAVLRAQRAASAHVVSTYVSTGRRDPGCPEAAVELLAAALCLPELAALELTFLPHSVVSCVRTCLSQLRPTSPAVPSSTATQVGGRPPLPHHTSSQNPTWGCGISVWELSQHRGTEGALSALRAARKAAGRASSEVGNSSGQPSSAPCAHVITSSAVIPSSASTTVWPPDAPLALGLRCAANASNASRSGPLHYAAERGDSAGVRALLELGASADARERAGCTPLFLACEAGHAAAAEALLMAGADAQLSNAAGESPLYISALRGHLGVVRALLRHFATKRLAWLEPWRYGDSWTPLMAATVANRHDVALALLLAAGPVGARLLVSAVNRYGQSVMHIAARKGSAQLLRLLLEHATAGAWNAHDTGGDTPLDVARKNGHHVAVNEFTRALSGSHRPSSAYQCSRPLFTAMSGPLTEAQGTYPAAGVAVSPEAVSQAQTATLTGTIQPVLLHPNACGSGAVAAAKAAQAAGCWEGAGSYPEGGAGKRQGHQPKSARAQVLRHVLDSRGY